MSDIHDSIERLIQQLFPESESYELHCGISNHTYVMPESALVIRVPRQPNEAWKTRKEVSILTALGRTVPVPEVIEFGFTRELPQGYVVLSVVKGAPADKELPLGVEFFRAIREYHAVFSRRSFRRYGFLRSIGRFRQMPYVEFNLGPYATQREWLLGQARSWWQHLDDRGSRYSSQLGAILRSMEEHARQLPLVQPKLIHGDLSLRNIIAEAGVPRAIIDWELAQSGNPAMDIHRLLQTYLRFGAGVIEVAAAADVLRSSEDATAFGHAGAISRYYAGYHEVMNLKFRLETHPGEELSIHAEVADLLDALLTGKDPYLRYCHDLARCAS